MPLLNQDFRDGPIVSSAKTAEVGEFEVKLLAGR